MKSKKISLSKLADILPMKEDKEFTIIFLSRPTRKYGRKEKKSIVINALDRFEAYKIASNRYGRSNVLKTIERSDNIRSDNFVTTM